MFTDRLLSKSMKIPSARGGSMLLLAGLMLSGSVAASQLRALDDGEMAEVSGTGLAFAFDDFRFQAAPTSYIEQVGGAPAAGTSFKRGDLRWFGATASNWSASEAASARTTWAGTCTNGLNNMGCPISTEGIVNYSNHDNPFVLRVFEYQRVGLNPAGNDWLGSPVVNGVSTGGVNRTVLELLGPSNSQDWRWSFWGEIQASETNLAGDITNVLGTLRNQNLILGKPAAHVRPPSIGGTNPATNPFAGPVVQLFQYRGSRLNGAGTPFLDESLGLLYTSRLSGDYRFSVNQIAGATNADPVPRFTNEEGFYFTDVNAYLPLGQLFYQAVVLDSVNPGTGAAGDGNFIIELTRIPNDPQVYNDFYSSSGQLGYQRGGRNARYYDTHGYVEWGAYFPATASGNSLPAYGTNSGLRFSGPGYTGGQSVTLAARTINIENFPGPLCGDDRQELCDSYLDTAAQVTVALSSPNITSTTTRAQIAEAGGISFVSRSAAGTWTVRNRQNDNVDLIVFDRDVMLWRTRSEEYNCGFLGCDNVRLRASSPNPPTSTAPAVLRNLSPELQVNAINLGTARVAGLLVQSLKITSLGAAD